MMYRFEKIQQGRTVAYLYGETEQPAIATATLELLNADPRFAGEYFLMSEAAENEARDVDASDMLFTVWTTEQDVLDSAERKRVLRGG